jgi:hypothetical protein
MLILIKLIESIIRSIYGMLIGWLIDVLALFKYFFDRRQEKSDLKADGKVLTRCQSIPKSIYKRPDPLIYSQSYLISQGLAVTWDNPDIQLFRGGIAVSSSELLPDTEYEVRATIYNGSNEAPAVNMPVDFSFLTFGIGTTSTFIDRKYVDLPVKGAVGHPITAPAIWKTPATPGHYCLQVNLIWGDDANPNNNLGQENTNVGLFQSPAVFEFPIYNDTDGVEHVSLEIDTYILPERVNCSEVVNGRVNFLGKNTDKKLSGKELCNLLVEQHKAGLFPIPPGWKVDLAPPEFNLDPHKFQNVKVTVTSPDSFTTGVQAFNINAYNRYHHLIGGVTLYTQR